LPTGETKKDIAYEIIEFLVKKLGHKRFDYNDLAYAWKRYKKPIKFTTLARYVRKFAEMGILRRIGRNEFEWVGD